MVYFIADLHLGHIDCLSYDNRPFANINEQDKYIIENWNNVVKPNDDVYILGDFSWYDTNKTIEISSKLNGNLHLIIGNHDHELLKNNNVRKLFIEYTDYKELTLSDDRHIVLSHYPIPCFNNHYFGWYHLYGHVHSSFEWNMMERVKYEINSLYAKPCLMYNVGSMMPYIKYIPRTLDYIISHS